MKMILSRKGFDSENGGFPSPILPSGQMISLPIPQEDDIRYSDVMVGELTYYDLMVNLKLKIKLGRKYIDLNEDTRCHLDPDIYKNAFDRKPDWKPLFGQAGAAQGHLRNQLVGKNDLFLFFGLFRKTVADNDKLKFDPHEREMHSIFGYFQIGEIHEIDNRFDVPEWMAYHPHAPKAHQTSEANESNNNTIYVARDNLSWDSSLPGAGRFKFSSDLILTKKGLSPSKWDLPDFFKEAEISHHRKNSWKDGYFQSAGIGQEFVIRDNERIVEWAKDKIQGSQIDR